MASVAFLAGAFVLHPIMALAGFMVWALWWSLHWFDKRLLAALFVLFGALGVGAVCYEPVGTKLLGHIDDEWRQVTLQICFFVKPANWETSDWLRIATALLVCLIGACSFARASGRFLASVLITAGLGLVGQFVAVASGYLLPIQASPYRTLWLVEFLAIPLLALWSVKLWRQGSPVSRSLSLAVVVLMTVDWQHEVYSSLLLFLVCCCVAGLCCRALAQSGQQWLWKSTCAGFVMTCLVLLLFNGKILNVAANTESTGSLDMHPYAVLTAMSYVLYKLPTLLLALWVTYKLLGWLGQGMCLRLALFAVWLGYQASAAVIPRTAWYDETCRGGHVRFVADYLQRHAEATGEKLTVYWPADLRFCWLDAGANSYFNVVQMSGCGFNRGTAMEGKRRAVLAKAFELDYFANLPVTAAWRRTVSDFLAAPPGDAVPNCDDLARLCADPLLSFVVLGRPIGDLYCATDGRYYIYDCSAIRRLQSPER